MYFQAVFKALKNLYIFTYHSISRSSRKENKEIYVPICMDKDIHFRIIYDNQKLETNVQPQSIGQVDDGTSLTWTI